MSVLHVACLCAAWCRTCESYATTLQTVVAEFEARGRAAAPRWIDIEDQADLVGDLDVQTFPTLLIHDERGVRFAGPLTPQPETLRRLLDRLLSDPTTGPAAVEAPYCVLLQRLRDGD